jgi:hypothetical protein
MYHVHKFVHSGTVHSGPPTCEWPWEEWVTRTLTNQRKEDFNRNSLIYELIEITTACWVTSITSINCMPHLNHQFANLWTQKGSSQDDIDLFGGCGSSEFK